jgi:hypothetical protein
LLFPFLSLGLPLPSLSLSSSLPVLFVGTVDSVGFVVPPVGFVIPSFEFDVVVVGVLPFLSILVAEVPLFVCAFACSSAIDINAIAMSFFIFFYLFWLIIYSKPNNMPKKERPYLVALLKVIIF